MEMEKMMAAARRSGGKVILCALATGVATPTLAQTQGPPMQDTPAAEATAPSGPASSLPNTSSGEDTARIVDIVVTAQRRSETLQKVPISITALQADALSAMGAGSTNDLNAAVAGLNFSNSSAAATPYLRGVGQSASHAGADSPVAFYVDGVYQPINWANIFSLNNIERLEVLKGPQGTLFGRNSSAGVIHMITRDPSENAAVDASIGYGNYDTWEGQFYGTTGLAPSLAIDLAATAYNQDDGWGFDPTLNREVYKSRSISLRSKLKWELGSDTVVKLAGDYTNWRDGGQTFAIVPGSIGSAGERNIGFFNTEANIFPVTRGEKWGTSLTVTHDFEAFSLVSISAYQDVFLDNAQDQDGTRRQISDFTVETNGTTFTQEVQILSPQDSSFRWIFGGFYMTDKAREEILQVGTAFNAIGGSALTDSTLRTRSYAGFGQATVDLAETTRLTVGARYTSDRRRLGAVISRANGQVIPVTDADTWNKVTGRVSLDHDFSDTVMGYASFNRGFKAGTYTINSPLTPPVTPETLDAYEVGLKTQLFDRHLRLNIAGFYYDYSDLQLRVTRGGATLLANAAKARIKGLDIDFEARLTPQFSLSGGFEYLDAKYVSFPGAQFTTPAPTGGNITTIGDAKGNRLVQSPEVSAVVTASYVIDTDFGNFALTGNLKYSDRFFWDPDNRLFTPSTYLLNTTLKWTSPNEGYDVTLWAKNLLNEKYFANASGGGFAGDAFTAAAPRTYGVRFGIHF